MRKSNIVAIFYAILASVLYAINIPISKLLLNEVTPTMMASYLYLGAGIGIGIVSLFSKKNEEEEKIEKKDLPFVLGMIILDILAPILLMFGLSDSKSSSASLLNNFEIVCTSIIALIVFKEVISKKMWVAILLITLSSFVLSIDDISRFTFSWGSILVILAALCWGFENNCTKNLSSKNVYHVVFLKGIFSGLGALIVALCVGEKFPNIMYFGFALVLGFIAYGLSIFFYVKSQGIIGASKTAAYYSIAPFVGALLSFIILKEELEWSYFVGLFIMIVGTVIVVIDTLAKKHKHMHSHVIIKNNKECVIEHSHEHYHYFNEDKHLHHHHEEYKEGV